MPDILHKVRVNSATKDDTYKALTTCEGLAGWWTRDTTGDNRVGGVVQFRFGDGGFDMEVLELDPGERVRWLVVDGPKEWIGTRIDWDLREDEHGAVVLFKHQDWKEPVEFMHHCSTKWAMFLMSLKSLVETGEGAPWPRDVKVDGAH
jgi:uncharacterized protein YndB with AHSA1/START domain